MGTSVQISPVSTHEAAIAPSYAFRMHALLLSTAVDKLMPTALDCSFAHPGGRQPSGVLVPKVPVAFTRAYTLRCGLLGVRESDMAREHSLAKMIPRQEGSVLPGADVRNRHIHPCQEVRREDQRLDAVLASCARKLMIPRGRFCWNP